MNKGLVVVLISSCALMISCAHKDSGTNTTTTEPATTTKKEMPTKKETTKSDGNEMAYTCMVAGDKRVVKMDKDKSRCEVHYTKAGDTQKVAWGEAHPEICRNTFDQIRNNIESRGFKCQTGLEGDDASRNTASN